MKAIIKKEGKQGLWMEDVPMPTIGDNDVLIQIEKTSICGTDIHLYKWDEWAQKNLPIGATIGHEFVGKIVETGKNVDAVKIGERVSAEGHITCGKCTQCRTGQRVLCPNTIGVGYSKYNGCFAQYFSVPAENVFAIPEAIPDEIASIFDPLGNTVHTALSFDLVGKDVLITGAGPIGLMAIPVVKKAGARHVVITDINPYRLELAKKMGATKAINVQKEEIRSTMQDLGIEEGFEVALEMSGSPQAFATLPELITHGGHLVILGLIPPQAQLDWHKVIFKMLTIKGIYGREIFKTWYQTLHMLQSGLDVSQVITHQFPAEEFQKGFDAMLSGNSGKVILDWTYLT